MPCKIPQSLVTKLLSSVQTIYAMHGPHDSDDFITTRGRQTIYNSSWMVDHNCSRTGIRLIGPKIAWSREDGGPAGGAHPSNVLDYPYPSPGGVNWTGDSPVIFPCDAPGFGGFVCSSTVPSAELWKLGQLSPGAQLTLVPISYKAARKLADDKDHLVQSIEDFIADLDGGNGLLMKDSIEPPESADVDTSDAILEVMPQGSLNPAVTLRQVIIPSGVPLTMWSYSANLICATIRGVTASSSSSSPLTKLAYELPLTRRCLPKPCVRLQLRTRSST